MENVAVLGDGAWGTALSMVLVERGAAVIQWSHSPAMAHLMQTTRANPRYLQGYTMPDGVTVSAEAAAFSHADLIFSAVPSRYLREVLTTLAPHVHPARPVVSGAAIAAAALFLPWFDAQPVRLLDRATGILFAFGAVLSFAEAARERPRDDETWLLWSWIAALSFLQLFVYWAVVSRYILFLTPPLAFVSARSLERRTNGRRLARVYAVSGALALLVSVALGDVDARFAGAQKEAAAAAVRLPRAPGARLWFTGHWGLQYYLEAAGATGLDRSRGGWDQVAPHDLVVVPATNANLLMPRRRLVGRTAVTSVGCFIPLRLMRTGSAGFYSSTFGFLPYALSRAPLDTFSLAEEF